MRVSDELGVSNSQVDEVSPLKKRRGRPSLKKHQGIIIGESTMPISVNSVQSQYAHELSEATAKKGFCSTPIMKLSPSKNGKAKFKSKLYEINNNGNTANNIQANYTYNNINITTISNKKLKKSHNELYSVTSISDKTTIPIVGEKNSTFSSSPLGSNVMTSEPIYQSSSPFNTSPITSSVNDSKFTTVVENNRLYNNSGVNIQSSPTVQYEDQFFRYINSSPIYTNISKRKLEEFSIEELTKQREENRYRLRESGLQLNQSHKIYRFNKNDRIERYSSHSRNIWFNNNYKYRVNLEIDDFGRAKIYTQVKGNEVYFHPQSRGLNEVASELSNESFEIGKYNQEQYEYGQKVTNNNYEHHLNAQRNFVEFRQQLVRNSMKSDPYMTENYNPIEYINSINSPYRNINSSNENENDKRRNNIINRQQFPRNYQKTEFEDYVRQEYEKVKTVDIKNLMNNNNVNVNVTNKGLSAGIETDIDNENEVDRNELNKIYTFNRNQGRDECRNDALIALRNLLLE